MIVKSRRAFLKVAASVAPLSGLSTATALSSAALRDSSFDPWIEIDASALHRNVAAIRQRVGGRPIMAVIKNNGYGAGVVNVARVLEPLGAIAGFAVVKLHEAVTLRDAGVSKPILLLGQVGQDWMRRCSSEADNVEAVT